MNLGTNQYKQFNLETVADGVYAALAGSNAGIIDLGGKTLIFDTLSTLGAGKELRFAAESLTSRPVSYAVNSHAHYDHYHGNAVFDQQTILISSSITRATIEKEGVASLERNKRNFIAEADSFREQLAKASDADERTRLAATVREYEDFLEGYPTPADLRLPFLTFERKLTFEGSKRTAELITFGGAHSPCDAVLWLPQERILFVADLIIPGDNLLVFMGEPENWLPILDKLEELQPLTIIPGHKGVTTAQAGFGWARDYLGQIFQIAEEAAAAGYNADYADSLQPPAGCRLNGFRNNMRFLIGRADTQK